MSKTTDFLILILRPLLWIGSKFYERELPRKIAFWVLICAPVLALAYNALSWLRYGIDIPLWDDWGFYNPGGIGSFDPRYLFHPANDTLFPVGKTLDSIAQRLLDGNSVAYQLISMLTVLGLLLLLQWKLLAARLGDRYTAACAFGLTVLMLSPCSYWGFQNIAYHHALPLVFDLAAIYIITGRKWSDRSSTPFVFILGILAGLSYISGAFSTLAMGMVVFVSGLFIQRSERRPMIVGGLALAMAGILTLIPQIWVIAFFQKGVAQASNSLALPNEKEFWLFLFGVVGKSLFPGPSSLHIIPAVLLFGAAAVAVLRFGGALFGKKLQTLSEAGTGMILTALFAAVFAYLLLVAAGRTHLRPPEVQSSFAYGTARFHFFWVTLLWPWLAAAAFKGLGRMKFAPELNPTGLLVVITTLFTVLAFVGILREESYYRRGAVPRATGVNCISSALRNGEDAVMCSQLYPVDLLRSVIYAKGVGASFVRSLPHFPIIPVGTKDPAPIFQLSRTARTDLGFRNLPEIQAGEVGYRFKAADDPMIIIKTGPPEVLRSCLLLQVVALMRVDEDDSVQVFYKPPGQKRFDGSFSQVVPVDGGGECREVVFELASANGFQEDFRFDPVMKPQRLELKELEMRCRVSR